ncbi:MAG: hypothetical protein J5829_03490 [Lachnospiraceae bacterium]|nr:hypothetical protein [Lachnospiraceae bacterium]
MRKRQWKKILSVVLALAMVFSMNITAFADEVADPVAVEEPAAEQPAETPAAEEPAAEEPAPEEEAAPAAEEPAPTEAEEPAGGTIAVQGWTFTYTTSAPEIEGSGESTVVTLSEAAVGIAETSDGSGDTIKVKSNGEGTATTVDIGSGKYVILNNGTFASTLTSIEATDTTGVTIKKVGAKPSDPVETTDYTIDKTPADKWTVKAADASKRLEYLVATSSTGSYANLDNSTGAEITAADREASKKMYVRVKAVFDEDPTKTSGTITTLSSDAVAIDYTPAPAPTPEGTFTVSGFTFEMDKATTVSEISYTGGIAELKFTASGNNKPEVTIKDPSGAKKALSVNIGKDVTLVADSSMTGDYPITLKNEGLFKVDAASATYEGVDTKVTISNNNTDSDEALVILNTTDSNKEYKFVVNGEDAATTTIGGSLKICSVTAAKVNPNFNAETVLADAVLSNNKAFTAVAGGTLKISEDKIDGVSLEFGHGRVLFADDATAPLTFTYSYIPARAANEFPTGLVDGQQRTNGVDVTKGNVNQKKLVGKYEFIISNNKAATQADSLKWTGDWDTSLTDSSGLVTKVANGATLEKGKTYSLYARRKSNQGGDGLFRSEAKFIGEFTTLKLTSISVGLASTISPNYAGDVDNFSDYDKELAFFESQNSRVLNSNFFKWTFNYPSATEVPGITVTEDIDDDDETAYEKVPKYENNTLYVKDSYGFKIGTLTLHFYPGTGTPNVYNWANEVKDPYTSEPVPMYALEPGHYAVSAQFAGVGDVGATYGDMAVGESNHVSFNVIKAPAKYEPEIVPLQMSGNVGVPSLKVTNQITGAPADAVFSGDEDYYINGSKAVMPTSFNNLPAGSYKIKVSQNDLDSTLYFTDIKDTANTDYNTEADLKVVDKTGLAVVGSVDTTQSPVYYGTDVESVTDRIVGYYTLDGEKLVDSDGDPITTGLYTSLKVYDSQSDNLAGVTPLDDAKISKISANQTVYAYFYNATYGGQTVSSAAIPVKIEKRPIDLDLKTGVKLGSVRGGKLEEKVSTNKIEAKANTDDVNYVINEEPFKNPINIDKLFDAANSVDIKLNTSLVDSSKPGTYNVLLNVTDANLSSNFATNYTLGSKLVDYEIEARYYVKYVLEYGGKKYVSSNVVDKAELDANAGQINIKPTKYKTLSWGSVDGKEPGVLGNDSVITSWIIRKADDLNTIVDTLYGDGDNDYAENDYVVFAVVKGTATKKGDGKAVFVDSIAPVEYDGTNHVIGTDAKANKRGNLNFNIYEEFEIVDTDGNYAYKNPADPHYNEYLKLVKMGARERIHVGVAGKSDIWRYTLEQKKDYKVSYKNNKNASVAYDPTVSGDAADSGTGGKDATFKQLFPENKRPQVIVTGLGNYKGTKVTILFDILPTGVTDVENVNAYYDANKTLKVTPKPYDYIWTNYEKDIEKKYVLKEGKYNSNKGTYTKDFVKEIYKITKDAAGKEEKRELVTNFKRIQEGYYVAVIKYVNNYMGTDEKEFEVKTTYLLDKQSFKWTKKKDWSSTPLTIADFKVTAKDKKKKAAIDVLSTVDGTANEKPGIYVYSIYKKAGKNKLRMVDYDYDTAAEVDAFKFKDAGVYYVTYIANDKLLESNSIQGTKTIQVEVKGTKLAAKDFKINEGKKLEYTGENTPIKVTLKKNLPVDENSKIPLADSSYTFKAADPDTAITVYNNGSYDKKDGYYDNGTSPAASLVKSGVYSVAPATNNTSIKTYHINIKPSGRYYADTEDGWVELTYAYSKINLKKAEKLISVINKDVEANVGGTPAAFKLKIKGDSVANGGTYELSGNEVIRPLYSNNDGKTARISIKGYTCEVKYSANKKTGTAKATIKPYTTNAKKYLTGSLVVPFTIVDKKIDTIGVYDQDALDEAGALVAVITDTISPNAGKDPKPTVNLYQVNAKGDGVTALKAKKDYTWKLGTTVSGQGQRIKFEAPAAGSFAFIDATHKESGATLESEGLFNTYGKKVKVSFTVSDAGFDAAKKGYTYTGQAITPTITSITIDGTTTSFPSGISESSNFIVKYNNNVKVGKNKMTVTVTLKKDSKTNAYPSGGSVTQKYSIVPQTNQNLILNQ